MGIATAMRELTQGITSSHKERTKNLDETRDDAKSMRVGAKRLIKGFHTTRKEESKQQKNMLADDNSSRKTKVKQMKASFQRVQKKLQGELKEASTAWQALSSARSKAKTKKH